MVPGIHWHPSYKQGGGRNDSTCGITGGNVHTVYWTVVTRGYFRCCAQGSFSGALLQIHTAALWGSTALFPLTSLLALNGSTSSHWTHGGMSGQDDVFRPSAESVASSHRPRKRRLLRSLSIHSDRHAKYTRVSRTPTRPAVNLSAVPSRAFRPKA